MNVRPMLAPLAVLVALTVGMAVPAHADRGHGNDHGRWKNHEHHRRDRGDRGDRAEWYRWYGAEQPIIRLGPLVVAGAPSPYAWRPYAWSGEGRRFSFGLYVGTAAPFAWVAPTPWFGPAAYGGVCFNLRPGDALVYVDGRYVGRADAFRSADHGLALAAGRHLILVRARGYVPMRFSLHVRARTLVPYRGELVHREH